MGCKAVGCKTIGDCCEFISYDFPLNPPGSLPGLARPRHLAADSQKRDVCLVAVLTHRDDCSTRMSFSFSFCRASEPGFKHHSDCRPRYGLYSHPDTERSALGERLVCLHETLMRPKVHLLGFHVWTEAHWFLDQSLIPMWSVRVYFGERMTGDRAGARRTSQTKPA